VVFGPFRVNAREEAFWYASYGVALWMVVAIVIARYGRGLVRA